MVIRIKESTNTIVLDSGYTEETYWYDELDYHEGGIDVYRCNNVFMVIPQHYGIIVYEDKK